MSAPIPIYLELGTRRVFACALDWPGWCRAGRDEAGALDALAAAAPHYERVAAEAGQRFPFDGSVGFGVVERMPGSSATDFGVPATPLPSDSAPLSGPEAERLATLVAASWRVFDQVVAAAPQELRKGPRGGGRDRDAIVEHVHNAEAAYARKLGLSTRLSAGSGQTGVSALRDGILDALRQATGEAAAPPKGWPARYAARRIAWHVLDHAWEIEDRATGMRV